MEVVQKSSSCHGVSFEGSVSKPVVEGNPWRKRFNSLRSFSIALRSGSIQRSDSRASSHFCDLDIGEDDDDVEKQKSFPEEEEQEEEEKQKQPLPRPPPPPESRLGVILLDQGLFTVYKRLFVVCFALNLTALLLAVRGHFPYARKEAAVFSVGNVLALVLCRNEAFLRCVFWLVVKLLGRSWVPLPVKTATTSFLQCLGGIHSGCGVSSVMWLIYSLVETVRHRETSSEEIIAAAAIVLAFLVISSAAAFPLVRHLHHNAFEDLHRFAGWSALAFLWVFVILTASYDPTLASYDVRGSALAKKQEFWFTLLITVLIFLPWTTIRKVPVQVSAPSGHASLIKFPGGIKAGILGRISRSPLSDWHAFGIISDGKDEHMMLAGAVGDFTKGLVSNPPKHLWTRSVHFAGLPYLINMYNKVVVVATGSGICVFLSFMLQPSPADVYVIWVAKAIDKNFGEEIVKKVKSYPPEKMIVYDTAVSGRPNVPQMTVDAVRKWGAEVVIVTSNPSGSRDVVNGCKAAGIPAFGPIWDS